MSAQDLGFFIKEPSWLGFVVIYAV